MSKKRGLDYWQKHLDAWHDSDLTQEAYCADYGLSANSAGNTQVNPNLADWLSDALAGKFAPGHARRIDFAAG